MNIKRAFLCLGVSLLAGLSGCASTSDMQKAHLSRVQAQPQNMKVYIYPKAGRVADGRYVKLDRHP